MIRLKVCGMREGQNITKVAAFAPDYMGFIFYDKSPRYVGKDFVMPPLAASTSKVGVFVNASNDEMLSLRDRYDLDFLQLHGSESVEQVEELKKSGARIFKVFSVDDNFDFTITKPYASLADFFLFDTKGKFYGGNAIRFNWRILERYNQEIPFLLSGGLTAESVAGISILDGMNLHALDVNSGVEWEPGLKDPDKVSRVTEELKKINNS